MTALILFAHDSRYPETEPVLEDVVVLVREKIPLTRLDAFSQIRLVWLDPDKPSLDTVCTELAVAGETQAPAVPLLFTDAFHSRADIPEQVQLCDRHGINITVAEGLELGDGTKRAVVEQIIEATENASSPRPVGALVMGVGSSDEGANTAVHQFAANPDGMLPEHVSAVFVVGLEKIKGVDVVAAAQECAARHGRRLMVVSLFTTPGLLWDRVIDASAAAGAGQVTLGEPLTELLAPIVCCRWDSRAAHVDVQVAAQLALLSPQSLAVTGPWSG